MKRTYCDLCGREIEGEAPSRDYKAQHEVWLHPDGKKKQIKIYARAEYKNEGLIERAEICSKCFARLLVDENRDLYG